MNMLYDKYLTDIKNGSKESIIFTLFLDHQQKSYLTSTNPKRQVIDFLCGMTDDLFLHETYKL